MPASLILILALIQGTFSDGICKALADKTTCVNILRCPKILAKLFELFSDDAAKRLQRVTCGIDGREPKVCCPKKWVKGQKKISSKIVVFPEHVLSDLTECGKSAVAVSDYIIGGKTPELGAHPWIARIGFKGLGKSTSDYFCGGTLIATNFILSASHCISSLDPSRYKVRLGEHDARRNPEISNQLGIESYAKDYDVKGIIVHPNYDERTKHNDIALLQLSSHVEITDFIRPICLPMIRKYDLKHFPDFGLYSYPINLVGEVAGFGKTSNAPNSKMSKVLQAVKAPILSNKECEWIYAGKTTITSAQMCAGGLLGKDSCAGDSGGSLTFFDEKTKRHFQIGIVSFGPKTCGSEGFPGIYTRVSSYLDWINESVANS